MQNKRKITARRDEGAGRRIQMAAIPLLPSEDAISEGESDNGGCGAYNNHLYSWIRIQFLCHTRGPGARRPRKGELANQARNNEG